MNQPTKKSLQVYKASAGSGKTYTLVEKYLDMLLQPSRRDPKYPSVTDGYKKILVATFTNKATTELRERIVKELRQIAEHGRGNKKIDETPQERASRLEGEKARARKVLEEILLDYSSLRVQTIDSFFQEVVRSFVLELNNSSASAEVALDSDRVIELSVDKLLIQQGGEDSLRWLGELLQSKAEEGEGDDADVRAAVIDLANQLLFRDGDAKLDPDIYTKERINKAIKELKAKASNCYQAMEKSHTALLNLLAQHEDILGLSKYGFLKGLWNKSLKEHIINKCKAPDKTVYHSSVNIKEPHFILPKKTPPPEALPLLVAEEEYRSLISHFENTISANASDYRLAKLLMQNLSLLPILSQLRESIDDYQREHRVVLIEEINDLVSKIINGSEVPFIYEKVGGQIMHYMLDEFQDTNGTQWENFKVLLQEGISRGLTSYIVGDVKQSIYRWRGTDSTLLNNQVREDLEIGPYVEEHNLDNNWRSSEVIVAFNNAFFQDIYDFEGHVLGEGKKKTTEESPNREIYQEGVVQNAQKKDLPGYVQIEKLIESDEEEEDALTLRLQELLTKLQRDDGYSAGDIAFIVRKNDEAAKIADILSHLAIKDEAHREYYAFLSDEALLVNNSKIVKLITSLYDHVADLSNDQKKLYFSVACLNLGIQGEEEKRLIEMTAQGATIFETTNHLLSLLQDKISEEEELYISAFLDLIHDFVESEPNTYLQFSYWWKKVGAQRKVTMGSDTSDKIEIITLHKAKGLEYPVVIIPYLDWEIILKRSNNLELCSSEELPQKFLEDPLPYYIIPEAPTKERLASAIGDKYRKIYEASYLDNLNLLYVAFTRPKERLYIYTKGKSNKNNVTNILYDRLQTIKDILPLRYDATRERWMYGSDNGRGAVETPEASEVGTRLHIQRATSSSILQRLNTEVAYEDEATLHGVTMHEVMSRTTTQEEFRQAIAHSGMPEEEQERQLKHFDRCMDNPIIRQWFTPQEGRHILTEQSIYIGKANQHRRPDRLIIEGDEATVIDFKFGEQTNVPAHRHQVSRYMQLLEDMGYHTKGYLWYWMGEPQIIEVGEKDL